MCVRACVCTCMYVRVRVCVCTCMCVRVRVYVHISLLKQNTSKTSSLFIKYTFTMPCYNRKYLPRCGNYVGDIAVGKSTSSFELTSGRRNGDKRPEMSDNALTDWAIVKRLPF